MNKFVLLEGEGKSNLADSCSPCGAEAHMVLRLPNRILSWAESRIHSIRLLRHRSVALDRGTIHQRLPEKTRKVEDRIPSSKRKTREFEETGKTNFENRSELQTLAEISPVGIFQTDAKGQCVYANERCCHICGMTKEEVLGLGWVRNLHFEDRERVQYEWSEAVKRKSTFKAEYRFIFHDRVIWVIGEAVPERDSEGRVIGFVGALTDITDRKNAEAFLQQSETRLNMALRTGRIVAWEWEAATNRLVRSDNSMQMLGLDFIDTGFPSENFLAAVDPKYRNMIEENLRRAFSGAKLLENEFELIRPDGSRLWCSALAEVIRNPAGKVERIVGVLRDVTLQKRAQESLENARRFLSQTLDALPSHVAILDESAKIIAVNSAWKKFADQNGFKSGDYGIGMNYLDICQSATGLQSEHAEKVAAALRELLQEKRANFYFEYPCHSPTEKRWFTLRIGRFKVDSVVRLFCSHHNVTEVKRGEEALRESEARFRQLADSMPQIVWSATADGKIDYQNKKFFEQTGLSAEKAADSQHLWRNILHPDDAFTADRRWLESVKSGTPFEMEYRYIDAKRGGYRWHLGRALPVRNERGEIVRWFGTCTDIEEHKQIEQALEFAQEQLSKHAANLEKAVGERTAQLEQSMKQMESFCYSIAHDLRAPLRAMQGFTTALCDDYGRSLDATGHEYAFRIVTSAQRMERLIQDLLNYGRLSHIEVALESVDLEKVVQDTLVALEREISRQKAVVTVDRPLPCIRGNEPMLEEVFNNLISNALKFVAPGIIPVIQIRAERTGDKIRVAVKDNGIGIEPEYHEKIFRVFEKVHGTPSEQATGIGLAIVRKSLERLGGQVGIESRPGQGSTFWFELPACDAEGK